MDNKGVPPGFAVGEHNPVQNILVVDDSLAQRKLIAAQLLRWGYSVVEAASGDEALEKLTTTNPDLILSDWLMPGMDGLTFCQAFRTLPQEKYVYFTLLTSKSGSEDIAIGLEAGADDFLTKPVNPSELKARIRAASRLLKTERELATKNQLLSDTLDKLQNLYSELDNDLAEAGEFQQSLLRERYRNFGKGEAFLELLSCHSVGGDLVGLLPVDDTYLGFFAIDVSGHGISSALMGARLAGYLSTTSPEQSLAYQSLGDGRYALRPPHETVQKMNRLIMDEMSTDHYFTLVLAFLNLETGTLVFSQAGHPHPVVMRTDGTCDILGQGGLPVGLIADATYEDTTTQLNPGDRLLIYSDGLPEQPVNNNQILGDSGLLGIITETHDLPASKVIDRIIERVQDYSNRKTFADDVSAILVSLNKS